MQKRNIYTFRKVLVLELSSGRKQHVVNYNCLERIIFDAGIEAFRRKFSESQIADEHGTMKSKMNDALHEQGQFFTAQERIMTHLALPESQLRCGRSIKTKMSRIDLPRVQLRSDSYFFLVSRDSHSLWFQDIDARRSILLSWGSSMHWAKHTAHNFGQSLYKPKCWNLKHFTWIYLQRCNFNVQQFCSPEDFSADRFLKCISQKIIRLWVATYLFVDSIHWQCLWNMLLTDVKNH